MGVRKSDTVEITFIRHGMTQSAIESKFLGWSDEKLLESERLRIQKLAESGMYPKVPRVYTSSEIRCRDTAYLIYKPMPILVMQGLECFNYGEFEGKTYIDLMETPKYHDVLVADGLSSFPNGDSFYMFSARIGVAFKELTEEVRRSNVRQIAIVTHENVIRSLVRRYGVPRSIQPMMNIPYGGGMVLEYDFDAKGGRILKYF